MGSEEKKSVLIVLGWESKEGNCLILSYGSVWKSWRVRSDFKGSKGGG